jgi:hypothetical protein
MSPLGLLSDIILTGILDPVATSTGFDLETS